MSMDDLGDEVEAAGGDGAGDTVIAIIERPGGATGIRRAPAAARFAAAFLCMLSPATKAHRLPIFCRLLGQRSA